MQFLSKMEGAQSELLDHTQGRLRRTSVFVRQRQQNGIMQGRHMVLGGEQPAAPLCWISVWFAKG